MKSDFRWFTPLGQRSSSKLLHTFPAHIVGTWLLKSEFAISSRAWDITTRPLRAFSRSFRLVLIAFRRPLYLTRRRRFQNTDNNMSVCVSVWLRPRWVSIVIHAISFVLEQFTRGQFSLALFSRVKKGNRRCQNLIISWMSTVFMDCSYITGYFFMTGSSGTASGTVCRICFAVSSITCRIESNCQHADNARSVLQQMTSLQQNSTTKTNQIITGSDIQIKYSDIFRLNEMTAAGYEKSRFAIKVQENKGNLTLWFKRKTTDRRVEKGWTRF